MNIKRFIVLCVTTYAVSFLFDAPWVFLLSNFMCGFLVWTEDTSDIPKGVAFGITLGMCAGQFVAELPGVHVLASANTTVGIVSGTLCAALWHVRIAPVLFARS